MLTITMSASCFARLAYAYYPYLRAEVDGNSVEPFQTAGRFIGLRLDPGKHQIVLTPTLSPLRKTLLALDGSLLILGAFLLMRRRDAS